MTEALNVLPVLDKTARKRESRRIFLDESSNEVVFAVVGHAGSGTSVAAQQLKNLLEEISVSGDRFDVEVLKARKVIEDWARYQGLELPEETDKPSLIQVKLFQDYGDRMRCEKTDSDNEDHAAIARALVLQIREIRAKKTNVTVTKGQPVKPDQKPRAYILDSIRHPAEVQLLRHVYKNAFVLIGVVCEEERRIERIGKKYRDAGRANAIDFMKRDADAAEKHGQHVADAFHLSDYFVDNTVERIIKGEPNPDWDVVENLSRLVKILSHSELVTPTVAEMAMRHAHSAQMQSGCLSRQVGAAVVDIQGNMVATGTNEVPKAGGGVYGESFVQEPHDARCYIDGSCRNYEEQNQIIEELIADIKELSELTPERKEAVTEELRKTRIGGLLEFSRAIHAEMDALLSAARNRVSLIGTRMFLTTFPCHYCARHIVAAGVDEVQYIEPYPKSKALNLHKDSIVIENSGWKPPSLGGDKVLFRPFSGVAPQLYNRAFKKDRSLKDPHTGKMRFQTPDWGTPWHLSRASYIQIEALLSEEIPGNA